MRPGKIPLVEVRVPSSIVATSPAEKPSTSPGSSTAAWRGGSRYSPAVNAGSVVSLLW
jgi:hypothetical protein